MPEIQDRESVDSKWCWWCGRNPWTDEHHIFRRSTSPRLKEDKNNLVKLCRVCHGYATENRDVEELFQRVFFLRQDEGELNTARIAFIMAKGEPMAPRDVSRYRAYLAAEYSFLSEAFNTLELERPELVEKIRVQDTVNSDKRAEILYEMSPDGKQHKTLRNRLKSIEKLLSALRSVHEQNMREATFQM